MKIEGSQTTLQRGDCVRLLKTDGTIAFSRNGERILRDRGDDKFFVNIWSDGQFSDIVRVIAELHGFNTKTLKNDHNICLITFK